MSGHFDNEDLELIAQKKAANAFAPGDPVIALRQNEDKVLSGVIGEGERVKLDAPFKLARARLESGEWLLKIELLDPMLLAQFREIVRRGANTYELQTNPVLTDLIDGVCGAVEGVMAKQQQAPYEPTIQELHLYTFKVYADFQAEKEKVMPLREMKFHMALGLAGELLELMEGCEIEDPQKRRENIEEELGDMLFFLTGIRRHYVPGVALGTVWADNNGFKTAPNAAAMLINRTNALIDLIKKDLISGKPVDPTNFSAAIGAVECFMAQLAKSIGLQMFQLADSNMLKLNKRYKAKFTEAEAAARADKVEQVASLDVAFNTGDRV